MVITRGVNRNLGEGKGTVCFEMPRSMNIKTKIFLKKFQYKDGKRTRT